MREFEKANQILIAVIDETYGWEEDSYERDSENYRTELSEEFEVDFEVSNVGPGADIPAFVTVLQENLLPLLPWVLAVFFSGKPMVENLGAWKEIFRVLQKYFKRPLVLSRNGAAAIAVKAVFEDMGGIPRSLLLKSYRPAHLGEADSFDSLSSSGEIENAPPVINLGMVYHLFEIEADGVCYLVGVNGSTPTLKRVGAV
jgi:hypothetical protein